MYIRVAVPRPLESLFDYEYDEKAEGEINVGDWVRVPFGKARLNACVLETDIPKNKIDPSFKIKKVEARLDPEFRLSPDVLELAKFGSEYYQYPLGEALFIAAPPKMDKKIKARKKKPREVERVVRALTADQERVLFEIEAKINEKRSSVFLLHGVTGSGKTEIYIELARKVLERGESVLILVPEIALTSQLKDRVERSLGVEIALWHSAMSDGVRQEQWRRLSQGEIKVVVGARSAIFSPMKKLGLIVVDEEHDQTYKQEERFRYQARDLAIYRAHRAGVPVILGSATPSLESMHKAQTGKLHYLRLKSRFSDQVSPIIEKISLSEEALFGAGTIKTPLAETSIISMQATIDRGEQVMVFLNRRGYSQFFLCQECGWVKKCPQCSISMTHYLKKGELRCHICNGKDKVPSACESCGSSEIHGMGTGTEALEKDLEQVLTGAKILRLDRDLITSHQRLEDVLDEFRSERANILVGTQMLVKGHDFPKVTCVVVIGADGLFHWPDFRAAERAYQTLVQVSGRSGRAQLPGKVLIQGYDLDHPTIRVLTGEDSAEDFIQSELNLRKELMYPPFSRLVRYRVEHSELDEARKFAAHAAQILRKHAGADEARVLGPSEALLPRAHGKYRFDVYYKAETVEKLIVASRAIKQSHQESDSHLIVDVDPYTS